MNNKERAEWLHDNYERFASDEGWSTQEKTRVPFDDLPRANKRVMLRMADLIEQEVAEAKRAVLMKFAESMGENGDGSVNEEALEYFCGEAIQFLSSELQGEGEGNDRESGSSDDKRN